MKRFEGYQIVQVALSCVKESTVCPVRTPESIANLCSDMRGLLQESIQIITISSKINLIGRHMVTLGLVNSTQVHPREVFRNAILDSASAIVMIHNHPSGDSTPSAEDVRITKQMIEAGNIIDIKLIDHIIIGRPMIPTDRGFVSMREQGLCAF